MNPIHRHARPSPGVAGSGGRPAASAGRAADGQAPLADGGGAPGTPARLVLHLVDTLAAANAELDLPNLLRHLPAERYRHAIACLRGGADADGVGLQAPGLAIFQLPRRAGGGFPALPFHRLLRGLRPDLLHTHHEAGLPGQLVAALAGVGPRLHAEHGNPAGRLAPGRGRLLDRLRGRLLRMPVDHFIAGSGVAARWLGDGLGVPPARIARIANGVDSVDFHPRLGPAAAVGPAGYLHDGAFVIGSIGSMDDGAGQPALVEAFLRLIASPHPSHQRLRLLLVGDGPARATCQAMLNRAGAGARAWLPGKRTDRAQLLRAMDLFVLPGAQDGAAAAILEAMASGLPVVAAAAGDNPDLVHAGLTGILVPPASVELLAAALSDYCRIPEMAARHGARARSQVIASHSMPAMARDYLAVYDGLAPAAKADPAPGAT